MKAQLNYGKEDTRFENLNIPELKPGYALIKIKACGICKSDFDFYFDGRVGDFKITKPIVNGHESSGVVVSIDKNFKSLKVGDRVVIFPQITCGVCEACVGGIENHCIKRKFLGCPPDTQGCYQEYILHPSELLIKINNDITFEEAAMIEPATIAFHGINLVGGFENDNKIGIIGAGTIGFLIGKLLSMNKKNRIFFFDKDEDKLNFALVNIKNTNGFIVNRDEKKFPTDLNIAFDASGSNDGINIAIDNMVERGKILLIGWSLGNRNVNLNNVVLKELMLFGSINFTFDEFKQITEFVNKKKITFNGLFESGYDLNNLKKVFQYIKDKKFTKPKVIIKI